ncbi:hypothetical protein [Nodularia sp. NIES-3585]|uniref:hypothetical protein n=1 Tax=Nodularia sp. NIES-3585 TaxID=1973477 RepID=UPI000B5C3444|nr:hypothetical protein [Nodularia sp. NIES-3585]GAX37581.1 hypothetical protein NIES3585_36260 [Nodularia sp. NIES-3585]
MKVSTNSFFPLLLAFPLTALVSAPASAAMVGGTWTGGTCDLVLFTPEGEANPNGIGFSNCMNKTGETATDLHLKFKIRNIKQDMIESVVIDRFFPDKPVETLQYFSSAPIKIWTFEQLIGFGYPAALGTNEIYLDNDSYWTKGGTNSCNPGDKIKNPEASKGSKSRFAWGLINPVLTFLMPPAYASEVCPIPEPNSSVGVLFLGTTLLMLGIKKSFKGFK